ncbi:cyclohexanone monooxygenase [Aaosphaeria arxii CBS 175.79]|uniref:Cyclohexanone monooxygenase n=1 Tax=Aaosphaeria arxii CBS 175.79 TaxID=1450172 RepID=A0A6A5Y698_9PLEO|nr:cyclohexanone monooxygenase [Aaosphaeria arxii CBS 175.79]KAF2020084.1 cyclohexanone monooxygenase [Aaosphaeria arxii CBS 175.79]
MSNTATVDYDAIVIGAGFGGIRSLWELKQLGLTTKCFEAASDVGGAWYWNRYPGARTDSEAWVYLMNFAPELREEWEYTERYPCQDEVQRYLGRVVDRFDLRKNIQFDTRVKAAHYCDGGNFWTVTAMDGTSTTCRYFLAATGPLSIAKDPPFSGLESYKGEWYQAANWPMQSVDFHEKRVAVIGTGATGVQIVPKLAAAVKELTVFQRTPNYVLPGRNYVFDQYQARSIKQNRDATWEHAKSHPFGLAMTASGKSVKGVADPGDIRKALDYGWETGGFHFQFETFDDLLTNQESNDIASDYLREKIRAIVQDPDTADKLCPKHPFMSKRPPCGHFYYESYNRPNVKLVDIRHDDITLYEKGLRTTSGAEYEFDIIIFALGFDAATGALSEIDIKGSQDKSLKDYWSQKVETFAGVLVPGFPNMFSVCGPHVPFGNMPVVLDIQVNWIGKTIRHMEKNKFARIDVSQKAVSAWSAHLHQAFEDTLFAESAKKAGAWFVGANIPGKANDVLFYFGGVPTWNSWLDNETESSWANMSFSSGIAKEAKSGISEQPGIQKDSSIHVT